MSDSEETTMHKNAGIFNNDGNDFGIGGINGIHHNMPGWDNTTVGMASSVFDNLLTQNGVRSNDPNYLGALEPIRAGKFIVKWLKVPAFFDTTAVKYLKFFLENAVRSVSGITSNQINASGSVTFGSNGQQFDFPGQLTEGNKEVTLDTITCTGDGLGKLMRYWMYGITDPVTGVHHMYGKNLRFIRPNYSGTLLYVFLGPTCRPGDIEYSCIWHEVWPNSSDGKDKFNSGEIGSDTAVEGQQVTLSGIFQDGPECNILAKYVVAGTGLAGQSYFDQMLPAYMYDKYITGYRGATDTSFKDEDGIMSNTNLTAAKRLGDSSIYTSAVPTRNAVIEQFGIDNTAISSNSGAGSPTESIKTLLSVSPDKLVDQTGKAISSSTEASKTTDNATTASLGDYETRTV